MGPALEVPHCSMAGGQGNANLDQHEALTAKWPLGISGQ